MRRRGRWLRGAQPGIGGPNGWRLSFALEFMRIRTAGEIKALLLRSPGPRRKRSSTAALGQTRGATSERYRHLTISPSAESTAAKVGRSMNTFKAVIPVGDNGGAAS
jgi:hypothetical protein